MFATVHSNSSRRGSRWCCMAVWGLALQAKHSSLDVLAHQHRIKKDIYLFAL
jgi:hypothetical protein